MESLFKPNKCTTTIDFRLASVFFINLEHLSHPTLRYRIFLKKKSDAPNNYNTELKEVIRNLIPPKGVKRKANVEGSELLDCEGEEISFEKF